MAPPPRKPAIVADIVPLHSLKSCLVNLPPSLVAILTNANTYAQNVVVELNFRPAPIGSANIDKSSSPPRSVFVGWTGMQSKSKPASMLGARGVSAPRDRDVAAIEIDATFAQVIGLHEGTKVAVFLHVDPPQAHTINIEPVTPADWEMIELHAGFLELNFLSQIRAVPNPAYSGPEEVRYPPHPITLHLSPTSTANIIVTSVAPAPADNSAFVKIDREAEVIVAPKTRKMERAGGKEVKSITGKKSTSGRSNASTVRRKNSGGHSTPKPVFLRAVPRSLGEEWFDDEDEEMTDRGLKVWVDRDILLTKAFRGASFVYVSVVQPAGLLEPIDPQKDATEPEKPTLKVVARIARWDDAPDSQHVGVSTILGQALGQAGIVGGLLRIETAGPQIYKKAAIAAENGKTKELPVVKSLKVLPFSSTMTSSGSGLKFGGESKSEREESLKILKALLGKGSGKESLLEGPLTDGIILPAASNAEYSFPGGILRFEPSAPVDKAGPNWYNGGDRSLSIEVAGEITRPSLSLRGWSPGEPLPSTIPTLVGIDRTIDALFSHLIHSSSVLLTGGIGSGKTNLTQYVAHRLRSEHLYHTIYFPCRTMINDETRVSTIKETLNRVFGAAAWGARSGGRAVIILDDLDKLCPAETELQVGGENGRSKHISECLIAIVRQYCSADSGVVLLAVAATKEAVHNTIIGGHVVREIQNLPAPTKDGRRQVMDMLLQQDSPNPRSQGSTDPPTNGTSIMSKPAGPAFAVDPRIDFLDLAGKTDGYMPGDLVLLISRARSECLIRTISTNSSQQSRPASRASSSIDQQKPTLILEDFTAALKGFTPASLRNVTLQTSTVKWDSIGGLRNTRLTLLETLQYPTTYAPIFAACPLRLRSGLLLYGFPGCGKTLLASAVASECGLNFISVKGPEILNKYIGASEQSVRDLFERASAARPCVLFFDEFDAIAPKRGHDSTGVTDRVVNQLLTQMDGAEGLSGVYVLAATSRPDLIDPALLRPGRLDKALLCDMPDTQDRTDILRAVSQKVRIHKDVTQRWAEVATRTEGYSGADLQALVYNAQLEAVHDVLGDHNTEVDKAGNRKATTNGSSQGQKRDSGKGAPQFSHFLFGESDDELEYDEEVGPKALRERVVISQRLREMAAIKAKRQSEAAKQQEALVLASKKAAANSFGHHRRRSSDGSADHAHELEGTETSGGVNGDSIENGTGSKEPTILWKHIESSLKSTRSSIAQADRVRLTKIYSEFVDGRSGDLPNGQGGTEVGGRTTLA